MLPNDIIAAAYLDEMDKLAGNKLTDAIDAARAAAGRAGERIRVTYRKKGAQPTRPHPNSLQLWRRFTSPREIYRDRIANMSGADEHPYLASLLAGGEAAAPYLATAGLSYGGYRGAKEVQRRRKKRRASRRR